MKLSEADIKKIQDYFATQKDVVAVYLYGSFASGNPHKGSDLDIAVLFDGKVDLYSRLGRLYSEFPKISVKAEPEVRGISLKESPVFLMNVIQGENIYSKDETKRIEFEVAIMREFYDTQRLRDIDYDYMKKRIRGGTYGY
ncbi:nucleotidyltransferase domain-containing protein [Candidatus Daviesbacteria bacterium]|nr:nucleotidyltransferase domain-containing protein [Candidatus Daviesbacteria bacterium]